MTGFCYRVIIRFWKEKNYGRNYSFEIVYSEIFQKDFLMYTKGFTKSKINDITEYVDNIEMDHIVGTLLENDLEDKIEDSPKTYEVVGEANLRFTTNYHGDPDVETTVTSADFHEVDEDIAFKNFQPEVKEIP